MENKEEKVKSELHRRHSDCHWVEVNKRIEKRERSVEKKAVG
jgi:deoxyadenosine/deoxycytidine kinase